MKECFSNIMQLCPISIHTRMIAECYYTFHVNVLICCFLLCYSLNYYLNTICYHQSHSYVQRFRTPYDYIIICKGSLILSSSFQVFVQEGGKHIMEISWGGKSKRGNPISNIGQANCLGEGGESVSRQYKSTPLPLNKMCN